MMSEDSLRFQLRKDLQVVRQDRRYETVWVIKDPVAFTHFLFSDQEYFILGLLDGQRSLADVQQRWQTRFKSASLSLEQLQLFCARLLNDGLLMVNQIGYGLRLAAKARSQFSRTLAGAMKNPLAIRFRGINPDFVLAPLAPLGYVLFHPAVIALNLVLAALVLGLLLGNVDDLAGKLPAISQLLSSTGLVWLLLTMAVIKILHEIGHGLACRVCGGECLEIGVMLLALTPCLYCNVSDAWLFPDRRKRMLVSAAGIYVEIILSALFAIVWFWTEPGWLNAMAFNVVLICSVNTILLNGNPLMRYDGYYLLSDLVDVPNLSQRGNQAFWGMMQRFFAGRNEPQAENLSGWLALYGGLSFVYRWFIVISILSGLYVLLRGYQMQVLAQIIAVLTIYGVLSNSMARFRMTGMRKQSARQLNWLRVAASLLLAGLFIGAVFFLPLPAHIYSPAVVELKEPIYVYAPHDGTILNAVAKHSMVGSGSQIIVLEDEDLTLQIEQMQGLLNRQEEHLRQLKLRENDEPELASRIPVVESSIREMKTSLELLQQDYDRLTVLAPAAGKIFPPERRPPSNLDRESLQSWTGTPLDADNRGCFVSRGDLLAVLGDPQQRIVVAYVSEREIAKVAIDSEVRLSFAQIPGKTFAGVVSDKIKEDVRVTPRELLWQQQMDSVQDATGIIRPLQTPYRVIITIADLPEQAFIGSTAQAKLRIANQTLANRMKLFLQRLVTTKI